MGSRRCSGPPRAVTQGAPQGRSGLPQSWPTRCRCWAACTRAWRSRRATEKGAAGCTASLWCVLQVAGSAGLRRGLARSRLLQQRRDGLLPAALLAAVALLAGAGRGQAPLLDPGPPACVRNAPRNELASAGACTEDSRAWERESKCYIEAATLAYAIASWSAQSLTGGLLDDLEHSSGEHHVGGETRSSCSPLSSSLCHSLMTAALYELPDVKRVPGRAIYSCSPGQGNRCQMSANF